MKTLRALVYRNCKLFFKDKGMFFTALITPVILLVLYITFLGNVYKDSLLSELPEGLNLDNNLIDGFVGGQLISSILAVSCVTVAFCSNMLMVSDKVSGARADLTVSPVKPSVLSLSYYLSSMISSLIICYFTACIGFAYIASVGWYLSASDVVLLLLDIFLTVSFGTALSSVIHYFLSSQGQLSAVGTIVSSGYGFLCGAYMPLSQFGEGFRNVLAFLPGTYATALFRTHALSGVMEEMATSGFPKEALDAFRDVFDCNIYFFGTRVSATVSYAILAGAILLCMGVFVLLNFRGLKKPIFRHKFQKST